ncbi:MAG: calcium/proton exchanger, partial [Chloroflexi bacterium]|nr:calcium/proton exchanger [Chloroflexota bacterium]
MTAEPHSGRVPSRLPVLGVLSPLGQVAIMASVGLSVAALALELSHAEPTLVFVVAAAAILGLAYSVGLATERLGALAGPQVGGILNATFGNVAELIIAFFALQAGLIEVVKASLTGSIIGNLLLVLGASVFVGGLRHGTQRFDQRIAGSNASLLVLAAIGLFVPAIFVLSGGGRNEASLREDSLIVAVILIVGYALSLVWQFTNPDRTLGGHGPSEGHAGPAWSGRVAILVLLLAAVLLAITSEILVGAIEPFVDTIGLSAFFVGVVLVPTIGNLAEHLVAVQLAAKNKMEFAMAVCFGSSL